MFIEWEWCPIDDVRECCILCIAEYFLYQCNLCVQLQTSQHNTMSADVNVLLKTRLLSLDHSRINQINLFMTSHNGRVVCKLSFALISTWWRVEVYRYNQSIGNLLIIWQTILVWFAFLLIDGVCIVIWIYFQCSMLANGLVSLRILSKASMIYPQAKWRQTE